MEYVQLRHSENNVKEKRLCYVLDLKGLLADASLAREPGTLTHPHSGLGDLDSGGLLKSMPEKVA
jgi:hypothetical protein